MVKVYRKICKYCGKEFETEWPNVKYCEGPHYKVCEVCGRTFELNKDQIFNKTSVCSEDCRLAKVQVRKVGEEYHKFAQDPRMYISTHFSDLPTYRDLCICLSASASTIQQCLARNECQELVKKYVSNMEQEVVDFISTYIDRSEIVLNDRNVIYPKELDIYLPSYQLAIECNPTYTHNSSLGCHNEPPKSFRYHKMKSDMCEKAGVRLLHIFGYEWTHKQDIIKSMILSQLGYLPRRIWARKCEICTLNPQECREFVDQNHRQGNVNASIKIGLRYEGELVSVMTFSRPRSTIGKNIPDSYELLRFCNKRYTTVVGGASKLFKYFTEHWMAEHVFSFSDRARTSGELYSKLNFRIDHISDPGYVWVNIDTDEYVSRISAQKHNIRKTLNDPDLDIKQTESQIMESHGYAKVYDSGQCYWIWNR